MAKSSGWLTWVHLALDFRAQTEAGLRARNSQHSSVCVERSSQQTNHLVPTQMRVRVRHDQSWCVEHHFKRRLCWNSISVTNTSLEIWKFRKWKRNQLTGASLVNFAHGTSVKGLLEGILRTCGAFLTTWLVLVSCWNKNDTRFFLVLTSILQWRFWQ